jgi:hypothetical protein
MIAAAHGLAVIVEHQRPTVGAVERIQKHA